MVKLESGAARHGRNWCTNCRRMGGGGGDGGAGGGAGEGDQEEGGGQEWGEEWAREERRRCMNDELCATCHGRHASLVFNRLEERPSAVSAARAARTAEVGSRSGRAPRSARAATTRHPSAPAGTCDAASPPRYLSVHSHHLAGPLTPCRRDQVRTRASMHLVQMGYIRRYRDWSIANRPKATNPSATAASRYLPNGCARIACSAPSSPCAFCRSKVSAA
jgi:hypothetical protein